VRGIFAAAGFQPRSLQNPFVFGLQVEQGPVRSDPGPYAMRLLVSERAEALDPDFKTGTPDARQRLDDIVGDRSFDIADEPQSDVEILFVDPAGAAQSALQKRQAQGEVGRNLQPCKQSRHVLIRDTIVGCPVRCQESGPSSGVRFAGAAIAKGLVLLLGPVEGIGDGCDFPGERADAFRQTVL